MKKPKRAVSSLGGMKNHPAEDFLPQAAARKHLGRKRPPAVAQLGPLVEKVRVLVQSARRAVAASFNSLQVLTNLEIGRLIVEHEQQGSQRADYGELVMGTLSTRLTAEFGRGFSKRNLEYMRQFYAEYGSRSGQIAQKPSAQLRAERIRQKASGELVPISQTPPGNFAVPGAISTQHWSHAV